MNLLNKKTAIYLTIIALAVAFFALLARLLGEIELAILMIGIFFVGTYAYMMLVSPATFVPRHCIHCGKWVFPWNRYIGKEAHGRPVYSRLHRNCGSAEYE